MFTELGQVKLGTGEVVGAAVVRGPDLAWARRIEKMLLHKGDPWNWQNTELLRLETGVMASFFVLYRSDAPFSNIMLVENGGVGLLGHVWTEPADRGVRASSILMERVLADFERRGGQAVFLGTGFDTAPWHYYRRRGFEPVEPGSGYMGRYARSREEFEKAWFGATAAVVEPLDWRHWPVASPLFLGDFGGVVRIVATQLVGRISEGPLLPLIRDARSRQAAGARSSAWVLRDAFGASMLGFASRQAHPHWPGFEIVDVHCHPRWWDRAADLLHALPAPGGSRSVAYCDSDDQARRMFLEQAGFVKTAILPQWVPASAANLSRVDVSVYVHD